MRKLFVSLLLVFAFSMTTFSAFAVSVPDTETEAPKELSKEDMLKICKWYITTLPSDDPQITELRQTAAAVILQYVIETKNFTVEFGNAVAKAIGLRSNNITTSDLFGVYTAGEVIYILEHDLRRSNADSFVAAMQDVMNFYTQLPKQSVKSLKKYLKMDEAERKVAFEKLYNDNK